MMEQNPEMAQKMMGMTAAQEIIIRLDFICINPIYWLVNMLLIIL